MFSRPATEYSWAELAELVNSAFEGYFTVVHHSAESLETYSADNFFSRENSHVFHVDEEATKPVAFIFLAVRDDRPGEARVAAMGVVPTCQAKGTGTKALQAVIEAEKKRGTRLLELECIQANERGLRLYSRAGFEKVRELRGWHKTGITGAEPVSDPDLRRCSLEEVDAALSANASPDVPWQARGFIKLVGAGAGFRLEQAYCAVTDPDAEGDTITIWCLIVKREARGKGQAKRLAEALVAKYPGKNFAARAIFPREYGDGVAKAVGAKAQEIGQYQMRLKLG